MSNQYQPTAYHDWPARNHGITLNNGTYNYIPYDYYAGDEIHLQNVVFRDSKYVTYDNTHIRFLNQSDIHIYDTSSIKIHDSGTLTMYTSASPSARKFTVDEYGRVGIGMDHTEPHSNSGESPSFDLDVKGQVGIEDYIYHNDNTDTYMLFGSDLSGHNVNIDGSVNTVYPDDQDEINFFTGNIAMVQMESRNSEDHLTINKNKSDVDFIVKSKTNTGAFIVSGDGSEVVINEAGLGDTDFRVEGNTTPEMLHVNTSVDHVTINGPAADDTDLFTVTGNDNDSLSGASLLSVSPTQIVINEDSNLIDTRIESNTNTTSILVKGDGSEVVVNDDGNDDTDFRVEGSTTPEMLHVNTSVDHVTINGAASDDSDLFTVTGNDNDSLSGASLLRVNPTQIVINEDSNLIDTRIESNTNANALIVKGDGSEVVVNDDSNADTDFRVKSKDTGKMLFVDSSSNMVTLSAPAGDDSAIFDIQGNSDTGAHGASLLYVDPTETVINRNGNDHNFRVVAKDLDVAQYTTDSGTIHTGAKQSYALFVDATNGRVGIGHDNPATTLHVAGSAHIEGDLWVKGVTNQIDTLIHATSAMDITNIGTGPCLTVTQSGAQPVAVFWDRDADDVLQPSLYLDDKTKMGIGTSSPAHAVHLSDTVESQAGSDLVTMMIDHNYSHGGLGINSTAKNTQNHVRFLSGGEQTWQLRQPLQDTTAADSLRFTHASRSIDVITMIPTGDVGIGVQRSAFQYDSAPQYRLQIAGDTNGSQDIVQITTNDTALSTGQEMGLTFGKLDASFGKLAGFYQGSDEYGLKLYSSSETSRVTETRGNFRYNDLAGITLLGDNKTGINVEAPTAQLHVHRSDQHETESGLTVHRGDTSEGIRAGAPILNVFNGTGGMAEVFRVQGDGRTGIGTTTPLGPLHVSNQNANTLTLTREIDIVGIANGASAKIEGGALAGAAPSMGAAIGFSLEDVDGTAGTGNTKGYLYFETKDDGASLTEKMRIEDSGNVGINITTPHTKLYVESTDGLRVPVGNTAQRPVSGAFGLSGNAALGDGTSGTVNANRMLGTIRYNTTQSTFEGFGPGYKWGSLGGVIDVDRDTYWTAVNDLENIYDDEFDPDNDYPGNPNYLRAFTSGQKRFAISNNGAGIFYRQLVPGTGTTASPYTYDPYLTISSSGNVLAPAILTSTDGIELTTAASKTVDITGHNGSNTGLALGGTLVTSTAAELNISDGGAPASAITPGVTDQFIINDGVVTGQQSGTMKQITGNVLRGFMQGGFHASRAIISGTSGGLGVSTTTSTELSKLGGGTSAVATTLLPADRLIVNDAGTIKQVALSDFETFFETNLDTLSSVTAIGSLNSGSITSGFGGINTGNNTIQTTGTMSGGAMSAVTVQVGTLGNIDASLQATTFALSVGGNVRADGDVIAFATSDSRFKDNLTLITDPIEKIKSISGYTFDWNDSSEYTGSDVGVVAQEVEQVLPEVVKTRDNGDKAVNYEKIVPLLIECIKSQDRTITSMKNQSSSHIDHTILKEKENQTKIMKMEKEVSRLHGEIHKITSLLEGWVKGE